LSDPDFDKSLVDASQLVSVLLVFLSVLFGINYGKVADALRTAIPNAALPAERREFRVLQRRCFVSNVLPVAVPCAYLAALLSLPFTRIIATSRLAFPDFNLVRTLFFTIELFIVASVIWSLFASWQLWSRIREAR
jgi:hypothetical protein